MPQLALQVRAFALQESPDIVILAGHSCLQDQPLDRILRRYSSLRYANGIQRFGLPSFDLPEVRA